MKREMLFDEIRQLIINEDPIGIYFDDVKNVDEYDPEAAAIIESLPLSQTEEQINEMVWSVFKRYFGERVAGPKEGYAELARKLWCLITKAKEK